MPPRHGDGGEGDDEELAFEGPGAPEEDAQGLLDDDDDEGSGSRDTGGGEHGSSGELRGPKLIATLIKSFIGSGVLFLPKAFDNGGWLFSVLSMLFMAYVSGLCIIRLIRCREVVKGTYGQVGRAAVGPWGQVAVDTSLVLSQAGFCCVYVVFIARNVLQLLNSSSCWIDGSWLWLLILLEWPLFTPLTWVRKLARFGPTNLLADGIIAGGLMGILAYAGHGMATLPAGTPVSIPAFNSGSFSLMLGTAVYAFEGIGMVLPIYDALAPAQQKAFPVTMSLTLAGVALVYITVGLVPYIYLAGMAGVPMEDAVTLNLPRVWWSYLITGGYCVALLFSYPLMLFPAVRILERAAAPYLFVASGKESGASLLANGGGPADDEASSSSSSSSSSKRATPATSGRLPKGHFKWRRNAYRAGIVFVTLLVAYVGSEQLDNFVSLIGCFCCTPLAFIYPALFHLRIVKNASLLSKAVDVAVLLFGVGILVFSTYEAIAGWSIVAINPCLSSDAAG